MVPERLTEIGGTHFDAPPGSQMTPSAPKATLGVPQRTVWAPHGAQTDLKSTPRGAKATSPGMQSHPPGAPWVLWVLPVLSLSRFCFFPLFFCVVPVFAAVVVVFCCCRCSKCYVIAMICSSLPRALDSTTHRHDSSQNRAGGMRGAIESAAHCLQSGRSVLNPQEEPPKSSRPSPRISSS